MDDPLLGKGERMSAIVIASINASAEIPNVPPCSFEQAATDADEKLISTSTNLPRTPSSDADPMVTEVADAVESESDPARGTTAQAPPTTEIPRDLATPAPDPDLWLYRERTIALLRRYLRLSIEVGRMPSLLGREFFRARVTSYKASTFEDSVIYVHDMERSLEELSEFDRQLIAKIVLQEYSKEEAAPLLGCAYRTVERLFPEALDRVSELLLQRGILARLPRTKRAVPKSCQGGENVEIPPSY
jgi:hypothetical protein